MVKPLYKQPNHMSEIYYHTKFLKTPKQANLINLSNPLYQILYKEV